MSDVRTVLVFGTFDLLHKGHFHFLHQARLLGDRLIVVVARDEIVRVLKHKEPRQHENERRAFVASIPEVFDAILGDQQLGLYRAVSQICPDVIAFGHDQHMLQEHLSAWLETQPFSPDLVVISKFEGETGKQ